MTNYSQTFLALVKAGLWENSQKFSADFFGFSDSVDWNKIYRLASEQSVLGLVLAGIETLSNEQRPPKQVLLQWIGEVQMLEQQNKEMNDFIAVLVDRMRKAGVYALLVKGQGVALCYERPFWRSCGDVDLLLDRESYEQAKGVFGRSASHKGRESLYNLHSALTINGWDVELHGTMRTDLGARIDYELDRIQATGFQNKEYRIWWIEGISVRLPSPNNDVLFVFTHILQHFFKGGVGLRQICDWCRLLWTYRDSLNRELLKKRLRKMGLMSEWKAFGTFAVDYMGMPSEAMPFYSPDVKWKRKADKICIFILEVGNMGHNRDYSYHSRFPFLIYKTISLWRTTKDSCRHFLIFPKDSIRIWLRMLISGIGRAVRGIT